MRACISIHALLAESDVSIIQLIECGLVFLSTLSLRRATRRHRSNDGSPINFYPRSPCGERPWGAAPPSPPKAFLSTLSLRRATIIRPHSAPNCGNFYPRSPCGERLPYQRQIDQKSNFYPRSPCGERLDVNNPVAALTSISIHALLAESDNRFGRPIDVKFVFLSTLSLRRATYQQTAYFLLSDDFYPRSPCGERRGGLLSSFGKIIFLSTLSLRRAT